MGRFVGGTDMPWHDVDKIYCAPGDLQRARQVTEAPDDFPVTEHPFLRGMDQVLVLSKLGLDHFPWTGLAL